MNKDNKEQAPEQEKEISVWHKGEKLVPESKLLELQQRIVQLEQERKEIASDAWRAAVAWEHWHYYEEIYGKLMPKDMRNNRPPQLHEYLSQFDQTKKEGV